MDKAIYHGLLCSQKVKTVLHNVVYLLGLLRPPIHFDRLTVIKKTG